MAVGEPLGAPRFAVGQQKTVGGKPAAGSRNRTLEHGGTKRSYRLHLPAKREEGKPLPLVIVLHGFAADGLITELLTGFSKLADKQGFAVAYPNGADRMWRFWEGAGAGPIKKLPRSRADDVGFLGALIDQLVKDGVADPRRVYVCGISNGAYMTNRLACDLGDRIAAIGLVAGTMIKGTTTKGTVAKAMSERQKPKRPMPVIYFHGTADTIVGIDGKDAFTRNGFSLSADEMAAWWARHNGCAEMPKVETLPDKADDGTTVERRTFAAGKAGAPVVYYKIEGGGHTWPGGSFQPEFLLGKTCRDVDASAAMWEIFSQHALPNNRHSGEPPVAIESQQSR